MRILSAMVVACLLCTQALFAQAEFEPNGTILLNSASNTFTAPVSVSANITNSPDDRDFFRIILPYCSSWSFNIVNPNGAPVALTVYFYNGQNTSEVILNSNGINFNFVAGIPNPVVLNASGEMFLQVDQTSGANLENYQVQVTEATFEGPECNNSFVNAEPLGANGTISDRIWGYDLGGNPDVAHFKLNAMECGVQNISVSGVNSTQRMVIEVFDSLFQSINSVTASDVGASVSLSTLLSAGTYYVRISEWVSNSCCSAGWNVYSLVNDPFIITTSFDSSDAAECNNTFLQAFDIPMDTVFDAKLWGVNTRISDGTANDLNEDQDFFRIHATSPGVHVIDITGVNPSQRLVIQVFDESLNSINGTVASNVGSNVSLATLLSEGWYYIRISEWISNGCCDAGWNVYNLADDPFTVSMRFDDTDIGECNNSFNSAHHIGLNGVFEAKIWGVNTVLTDGLSFDRIEDQDFYQIVVPECGVFNMTITGVAPSQRLVIEMFDDAFNTVNGIIASNVGESVSLATTVSPGGYYIRLSEWVSSGCCDPGWNVYNLADDPFMVSTVFDISDPGECNNTFEQAPSIPLNTTFEAKIWGVNYLLADGTIYDRNEDQDFYRLDVPECGNLNWSITGVSPLQRLVIQLFDSSFTQVTSATASDMGANVSLNQVLSEGVFYVRVSEWLGSGCCSSGWNVYNLADDPFSIAVTYTPFADITTTDLTVCEGEAVNFIAGSGGVTSWLWSFGEGNNPTTSDVQNPSNVVFNAVGQNIVRLVANGCSVDSLVVNVWSSQPTPSIIQTSFLLEATEGDTFRWFLNGVPIEGASESEWLAQENGVYMVCVSTDSTCGEACSEPLLVTPISVNEIGEEMDVQIFPNPSSAFVQVRSAGIIHTVRVLDMLGKCVDMHQVNASTVSIDVSEWPAAFYTFLCEMENGQMNVVKVIRN